MLTRAQQAYTNSVFDSSGDVTKSMGCVVLRSENFYLIILAQYGYGHWLFFLFALPQYLIRGSMLLEVLFRPVRYFTVLIICEYV